MLGPHYLEDDGVHTGLLLTLRYLKRQKQLLLDYQLIDLKWVQTILLQYLHLGFQRQLRILHITKFTTLNIIIQSIKIAVRVYKYHCLIMTPFSSSNIGWYFFRQNKLVLSKLY